MYGAGYTPYLMRNFLSLTVTCTHVNFSSFFKGSFQVNCRNLLTKELKWKDPLRANNKIALEWNALEPGRARKVQIFLSYSQDFLVSLDHHLGSSSSLLADMSLVRMYTYPRWSHSRHPTLQVWSIPFPYGYAQNTFILNYSATTTGGS